jgi:NADH:ubiquinone oxidoreductase subunit 5 (subunit L)/multisubunit Na+/H+ antiporter MnhA subunit
MSAPTPISSLVHSSTLVTSGLYLLMRFSSEIYSHSYLLPGFIGLAMFTSLYAGLNSLFEVDLKKIIALSTLRHLGFIGLAMFRGAVALRFFHLLVHALFKSLLFIGIGDVITSLSHSQDSRFLSGGGVYTPLSSFLIMVSVLNLLGLPSIRGFLRKDLVVESLSHTAISSFMFEAILYLNVALTYVYTLKIISFSYKFSQAGPFLSRNSHLGAVHFVLLAALSIRTAYFWGLFFRLSQTSILFILPLSVKSGPFVILVFVVSFFVATAMTKTPLTPHCSRVFGTLLLVTPLLTLGVSRLYSVVIFGGVRSLESGFLPASQSVHFISVYKNLAEKICLDLSAYSYISKSIIVWFFISVIFLLTTSY